MEQVPHYALIGSGHLAQHLSYYLKLQNLQVLNWSRDDDPKFNTLTIKDSQKRLQETINKADYVLFAISDSAIENFSKQIKKLSQNCIAFIFFHIF